MSFAPGLVATTRSANDALPSGKAMRCPFWRPSTMSGWAVATAAANGTTRARRGMVRK
ncbi:MAG: hypothetical protein INH37_25920 [Myxococcaceae bacterium]|nr:hypothetical protein [Myxococcaceae bacterium]